jgi:hypothetical protein
MLEAPIKKANPSGLAFVRLCGAGEGNRNGSGNLLILKEILSKVSLYQQLDHQKLIEQPF